MIPQPKGTVSAAFREAWDLYPLVGRRRSSTKDAWAEWRKACKECPEADLVARVRRYVAEDKDQHLPGGPPAFHRWLKWGRWEHWAPLAMVISQTQPPRIFPDVALRAAFHLRFQDERARQWFDKCELEGDEIVGPISQASGDWLYGPFQKWALLNNIGGVRSR